MTTVMPYRCAPSKGNACSKIFWSVFIILILIKNDVAETGNCIRPPVKSSPIGPIDRVRVTLTRPDFNKDDVAET